ncbi:6-phosphogluconate dehydrogenase [Fusarium solani]|uniref:6-phosphogluconate dehydrogenase, decarboxylating n=1 Tax=Fusarium solani TaxID=169388 RepID=A0A9P9HCA7_FUSSL|nr:6-phosphogluconate dehydrogenase [Fusarium solani]KAH7254631.1 6-phosphogluconate dehydrogenase [Fusarium solani]
MEIQQIGMIGVGSMGAMMSLLLAEKDIHVYYYDPSQSNSEALESHAEKAKLQENIHHYHTHESLCGALSSPRAFILSIPHGNVGDETIDAMLPWLSAGDIIMDASNEHWKATERRQKKLGSEGVEYIGMGVSGGYQSARHGPSICPGGAPEALDKVLPFLEIMAARDKQSRPCVAKLGPGGCGHYVKMVHNGIEQGIMTALCEVWGIMAHGLGMSYDEIGDVFEAWNSQGPLRDNFLVSIGSNICRAKDPKDGSSVLGQIRDKVVQDYDDTEGTGTWTCEEGARLHVCISVISASHFFRLASADAARRNTVSGALGQELRPSKINIDDRDGFIKNLQFATYGSFLVSFVQGLHLISKANAENEWNLNFCHVLQLWRGGAIIQSDEIVDLLEATYRCQDHDSDNLLGHRRVAQALLETLPSLKDVVLKAIGSDAYVPALAASLEYIKYSSAADLPTSFQEAQLDYFGEHMYDLKRDDPGRPVKGKHHFEWKPARGINEAEA